MSLRERVADRRDGVCRRWLDAVLAEYGEATASRWRRERDPFANPVGHLLSTGLPELVEAAIADGAPPPRAVAALESILRVRSVQELPPSQAVSFVLRLRDVVRAELAEGPAGPDAAELAAFDARVEQLTLLAFDVYVGLREQLFRVRQEELKRSVASVLRRWHGQAPAEGGEGDVVQLPSSRGGARR